MIYNILSAIGLVGLGSIITFIVDRLITIAKVKHEIKRDRFKLKVDVYAEWITKSKQVQDIMSDTSFLEKGGQSIEESIDYIRNSRNKLKFLSSKIVLLYPQENRKTIQKEYDNYFIIWKNLLEDNYKFRNAFLNEKNESKRQKELSELFATMKDKEKKLYQQNKKIIDLIHNDIDL